MGSRDLRGVNGAVGRALRVARRREGLTLRDVEERSGGRFRATSIASYERNERTISIARFCQLCAVYGVDPPRLLASSLGSVDPEPAPEQNGNPAPSRGPVGRAPTDDASLTIRLDDLEIDQGAMPG